MNKISILIKNENSYKEFKIDKIIFLTDTLDVTSKKDATFKLEVIENKLTLIKLKDLSKYILDHSNPLTINNKTMYVIDNNKKHFNTKGLGSLSIGTFKEAHILLNKDEFNKEIDIKIDDYILSIYSESDVYINGKILRNKSEDLLVGDVIFIDGLKITFYLNYIEVVGSLNKYNSKLEEKIIENYYFDNFPIYKRSPRIIKKIKNDDIEIINPPSENKMKKGSLIKIILPPLVMISLTIIMSIIQPRGLYVIVTLIGTLMSTIFSITAFINEKKENTAKNKKRYEVYSAYLLNIRKLLGKIKNEEIESLTYNNPNIYEIENLINTYNSRIYERNLNDFDFINIDIGKADMKPSFSIRLNSNELNLEDDPLVDEAKNIKNKFSVLNNMPLPIDLKSSHLGIVGDKSIVHEQLKLIFSQLTFSQSYHDVEIIFLHDKKYREEFNYLRWYPHFKNKATNVTGIIDTERIRDQILGSLNKILKERKLKEEEKNKEERFSPHFIFVIDEPSLIINHSIMEYLQNESNKSIGFSIIYTTNSKANLPEYIKTVITLDDKNIGNLLIKDGVMINKKFKLNHIDNVNLEELARKLACLEHVQGISNNIPESITFFEMYNINHPHELNISKRWEENQSHKSLAVPLGVRGENDFVELNLHEKAHGPHGLVAGTTGSGKSEIVQSYILSLAVNFHPYEVGFLLIDYKGGGMASLFKNLPHLLGTITNLDGAESMRAMASIKSELARRQQLFSEYEVNHINAYNKLFKSGKATEPLPHLFLISDEFAELKKEQPEFMSELVSAARIGRSLGIHLILATQKPSGVVDDQIWSNSKFKLALKVQNEGDSNEILKTPDAAGITLPGRAFLQVGNNEIYELFQSAWSGASYEKEEKESKVDDRVYLINDLGQNQLLNKDLSLSDSDNSLKETELDVVVNHISETFNSMNMANVRKPWLPSLEDNIKTPHVKISEIVDVASFNTLDMNTSIALIDIPEQQRQCEYILNFENDGNLAIFSSPGFGKSTTLTTIAISMAVKNSPKLLNYYVIDLGNSALIQLKSLPHTADYLNFDDNDKLNKLIKILEEEIKVRKKLLGDKNALNFNMYNKISNEKLPAKVIFIDNYDVIKEFGYEVEDFMNKLSRDGVGLGIYLIITASRSNSVKYATLNNFKNKITHYMFDNTEINAIVGRSLYGIKEIKGRALVKQENVNTMQVFRVSENPDDMEYTLEVGKIIEKINSLNSAGKAKGIPTLPKELNKESIKEYIDSPIPKNNIPIGLDIEKIQPVYLDLNNHSNIIVGSNQSGKTSLLKLTLENVLEQNNKAFIFDSTDMEFYNYKNNDLVTYVETSEDALEFLEFIKDETLKVKLGYEDEKFNNPDITPREYYSRIERKYIFIDDIDKFLETIKSTKSFEAEKILQEGLQYSFKVIGTTNSSKMKGFDNITKLLKDNASGVILGLPNEQMIFTGLPILRVKKPEIGFGFAYKNGELKHIMIPRC